MRQAIATKYLGPTNHRGARVKATCDAGSVTVAWDYSFAATENHLFAARHLAEKLSWTDGMYFDDWAGGAIGNGYVWVYVDNDGWQSSRARCVKGT